MKKNDNNISQKFSNEDLIEALLAALSGYTKEAYLEGYDNALLNKHLEGSDIDKLFAESHVKKQIRLLIQQFASKNIPTPENYVPCPYCLRLTSVKAQCECKHLTK